VRVNKSINTPKIQFRYSGFIIHNENNIICSVQHQLDAIKTSIITFHQVFPQSLPKYHSIDKNIQSCPTLYFPKNVLPSSADEKRLSSSRNSTTLPPPSLSTVNFAVHRSTTHATHRFAHTCPRRNPIV